jgi:hypothetical protein
LVDDKPPWYYYPYYSKKHRRSCVVGIEEIMSLDKGMMIQDVFKKKAIIVVIEPEHAINWTEPKDISWKDLANGKIKPFYYKNGYIMYIKIGDCTVETKRIPSSYLEWQQLCGITEEDCMIIKTFEMQKN